MKICLINPPVLGVLEPWYDQPDFGRTGLAYLAGYLRQFEGYEINIIDAKFERINFQEVLRRVLDLQPDIVGLTAFTNEIKPAAYQAALIKEKCADIVTIIGGVHVTALPIETLKEFSSFDIGVVGEGEVTLHELCTALQHKQPLEEIEGLVIRQSGQILKTATRKRTIDLDTMPLPAWDLLPKADTYFIQTLRGCPYACKFCMNPNGRVARKRSVSNVIDELNWIIQDFHPKRVSYGDELFSIDIPRTKALLIEMAEEGIGDHVKWDVQTHVNYVNYELFQLFKKAKVDRVELGIETGDLDIMRKMGKGTNIDMITKAYSDAKKAGVKIGTFFIIGQPNESKQSIKSTIKLAQKINPELPMFGVMTPYPGTAVAKMAAKGEGGYKLLSTDWDEYNKQIGGAMEFANLTRRQIEWIQLKAYASVFLGNGRILDFLKLVWEYRVGAFKLLKKMLFNRKSLHATIIKPSNYDTLLSSDFSPTAEVLIESTENWNKTQKTSLKRIKEKMPELTKLEQA